MANNEENNILTDEDIKKLTPLQLIKKLSIGAWVLIITVLVTAFSGGYWLGNNTSVFHSPVSKQETTFEQLSTEQRSLLIEIWKYQKSGILNTVFIYKEDGFILDDSPYAFMIEML